MPPVSPDGGARFAKALTDLYGDAAQHLLTIVAARLSTHLDDPGWAERKLSEILLVRRDAQRLVQRLGSQLDATLYDTLVDAYASGVLAAGGPQIGRGAGPVVGTNRPAVEAYARVLSDQLGSTHTRILRTAEDVYRRVIADTVGQAVTGVQTRREVAARAVSRAAQAGITGFTDRAGRSWQLETYVEMAARTTLGQVHVQGALDDYARRGRTLVIVSDVPEECDRCRPYEGRVLSLTGAVPTVAELGGHRYGGTLRDAQSKGFLHPNCRHALDAFVPGLTTTPPRPTADPDGAEQRARQRALERRIREWKRRAAASEQLGNTEASRAAQAGVRLAQADMRHFIADTGRKRLAYREQLGAR